MKAFTFKWLLGNVSNIEGLRSPPDFSDFVWLLKRAGGGRSVSSSLFHVLLLLRPGLEKAGHSA